MDGELRRIRSAEECRLDVAEQLYDLNEYFLRQYPAPSMIAHRKYDNPIINGFDEVKTTFCVQTETSPIRLQIEETYRKRLATYSLADLQILLDQLEKKEGDAADVRSVIARSHRDAVYVERSVYEYTSTASKVGKVATVSAAINLGREEGFTIGAVLIKPDDDELEILYGDFSEADCERITAASRYLE